MKGEERRRRRRCGGRGGGSRCGRRKGRLCASRIRQGPARDERQRDRSKISVTASPDLARTEPVARAALTLFSHFGCTATPHCPHLTPFPHTLPPHTPQLTGATKLAALNLCSFSVVLASSPSVSSTSPTSAWRSACWISSSVAWRVWSKRFSRTAPASPSEGSASYAAASVRRFWISRRLESISGESCWSLSAALALMFWRKTVDAGVVDISSCSRPTRVQPNLASPRALPTRHSPYHATSGTPQTPSPSAPPSSAASAPSGGS